MRYPATWMFLIIIVMLMFGEGLMGPAGAVAVLFIGVFGLAGVVAFAVEFCRPRRS